RPRRRAGRAGPARARRSTLEADLDHAEARGRGPVRDVRVLARLALAAVRQPVQEPLVAAGDSVQGPPEDRRLPGVGRVAEHAAELPVLDLPGHLRPELEVEP